MTAIIISPHDDDSILFTGILAQRTKAIHVIVTDSYLQPLRGEAGCSAEERARETAEACKILGCSYGRLKIPDNEITEEKVLSAFEKLELMLADVVYAPAVQGGNPHHDIVARAAMQMFHGQLVQYTTYTPGQLYTTGTQEIIPTPEEMQRKIQALSCYQSQLRLNSTRPHFDAVLGKSEWLIARTDKRLHLGCGDKYREGWVNVDRCRDVKADHYFDVAHYIDFDSDSFDYVYSEDFLEHLPPERTVAVMNEICRVLKPGGMMEHFVPFAGSRNSFGSPSHLSFWNRLTFEHFNVESDRYKKDRKFEGVIGGFEKVRSELVNWQVEEDGVRRAQSIHVKYRKVASS